MEEEATVAFELGRTSPAFRSTLGTNNGIGSQGIIMFGTEDRLTPPELGRHYAELLPHAHLVLIYDAAHAVDADRPEAFAALVSDFLEHREQFVVRRSSGLLHP